MKNLKFWLYLFFLLFIPFSNSLCLAQNNALEISFTAINDDQFQPLDSIKVSNLTQGCDTMLIYPDTILSLDIASFSQEYSGTSESDLSLTQNYPNPFKDQTRIKLHLQNEENINIIILDLLGNQHVNFKSSLEQGFHSFIFCPRKEGFYLCTVFSNSGSTSIKMLAKKSTHQSSITFQYINYEFSDIAHKSTNSKDNFFYISGDELLFIGYSETMESGIVETPVESQAIEFQFASNIPCPEVPSIIYGNQEYNTIQIFSQCWLKESLNYEIENSWCINNNPNNCEEYGRLYLWDSAINICPEGWHLPSDNEWKIIEGVTDSQYGIEDAVWNLSGGWRGYNAGSNLKSLSGWFAGGNGFDLFGFEAKPGGYQLPNGNNGGSTLEVGFWTSSEYDNETAWHRFLQYSLAGVYRYPFEKEWALYVRCIKN